MSKITVLILIALAPLASYGQSEATNVLIQQMQLSKTWSGIVFIKVEDAPSGKPTCSNHFWDYTLDLTAAFEQQIYATLLAAFVARAPVTFSGMGACNEHGEIESLGSVGVAG